MITNTKARELFTKYDVPSPRYTSYPAYPQWTNELTQETWLNDLKNCLQKNPKLDIYVHVPFCESPCLYCGCNRIITKDDSRAIAYVESVKKELDIYKNSLPKVEVSHIHLGGGTPTFLSPELLSNLITTIKNWGMGEKFTGSVEVDPRVTSREHVKALFECGFRKISLGVQDFNSDVQKAINRIQPFEMIQEFVQMCREEGMDEVNLDLIHGLPLQTAETFQDTITRSLELKPDTVAIYAYAHVPWKITHQKALEKYPRPEGYEKRELFDLATIGFEKAGYLTVGLDHFAAPGSSLYKAQQQQTLNRTFMGHTDRGPEVLLGLGTSSISATPNYFAQNEKETKDYSQKIDSGVLAISSGHQLSCEDKAVGKLIKDIMCNYAGDMTESIRVMGANWERQVKDSLIDVVQDGLIDLDGNSIKIKNEGLPFLRPICMKLDWRLLNSRTINQSPQPVQNSRL